MIASKLRRFSPRRDKALRSVAYVFACYEWFLTSAFGRTRLSRRLRRLSAISLELPADTHSDPLAGYSHELQPQALTIAIGTQSSKPTYSLVNRSIRRCDPLKLDSTLYAKCIRPLENRITVAPITAG